MHLSMYEFLHKSVKSMKFLLINYKEKKQWRLLYIKM